MVVAANSKGVRKGAGSNRAVAEDTASRLPKRADTRSGDTWDRQRSLVQVDILGWHKGLARRIAEQRLAVAGRLPSAFDHKVCHPREAKAAAEHYIHIHKAIAKVACPILGSILAVEPVASRAAAETDKVIVAVVAAVAVVAHTQPIRKKNKAVH